MILRGVAGFSALGLAQLGSDLTETTVLTVRCVAIAVAILLWIGLWTPLVAVAAATLQICMVVGLGRELGATAAVNAALGMALAMLGPGCWSLDARLFGRKRIV